MALDDGLATCYQQGMGACLPGGKLQAKHLAPLTSMLRVFKDIHDPGFERDRIQAGCKKAGFHPTDLKAMAKQCTGYNKSSTEEQKTLLEQAEACASASYSTGRCTDALMKANGVEDSTRNRDDVSMTHSRALYLNSPANLGRRTVQGATAVISAQSAVAAALDRQARRKLGNSLKAVRQQTKNSCFCGKKESPFDVEDSDDDDQEVCTWVRCDAKTQGASVHVCPFSWIHAACAKKLEPHVQLPGEESEEKYFCFFCREAGFAT